MISKPLLTKAIRFLVVGTLGFITDAGILWAATNKAGLDPYTARLMSFSVALVVTWALNSRFTFKNNQKRRKRQFGAYITVQVSSFGLNYAIYSGIVWLDLTTPLTALVIASIMAMFYSFTAMNLWVFKNQPL
ncbi:GtrA family protein [Thalassospira tepidiphila]|uniref:GtrA family protein n=1 Tax=Thalassospira tepidiphila TaxID=393657 RepID=UPI003AA9057C